MRPFCVTCRTNVRDPLTHRSTQKHRAAVERRSRPVRDVLPRRQPAFLISLRQYEHQYDEVPEGWVPSPEWSQP